LPVDAEHATVAIMSIARKFLVIADGSEESRSAAYFAARRACNTGGGVAVLAVAHPQAGFETWLGVSETMRADALHDAETALESLAEDVEAVTGTRPELILREGDPLEALRELIKTDESIAILVLGAAPEGESPGPLVSALARGRGLFSGRAIPVTVVPGGLSRDQLKALS